MKMVALRGSRSTVGADIVVMMLIDSAKKAVSQNSGESLDLGLGEISMHCTTSAPEIFAR
jgi:hypothetical protein